MGDTVPPVGPWQPATVAGIRSETPAVKTFELSLSRATPYLAGQYFVVRLTAPDGYTAQRSYSVASPPGDGTSIELTIERLADGDVSVSVDVHSNDEVGRLAHSFGRTIEYLREKATAAESVADGDLTVQVVPGSRWNIKITYSEDLTVAERLISRLHR